MKHIAIMRHAKSSWDDFSIADIDRPLNKRGKRDAPVMAEYLLKRGFIPESLIISSSERTRETARHFQEAYGITESNILIEKQLYLGSEYDFIETMYSLDDNTDNIMMFGHNPGLTHIANICSDKFIPNVPTSGILIIDMDINKWTDASWDMATLKDFYFPKGI